MKYIHLTIEISPEDQMRDQELPVELDGKRWFLVAAAMGTEYNTAVLILRDSDKDKHPEARGEVINSMATLLEHLTGAKVVGIKAALGPADGKKH